MNCCNSCLSPSRGFQCFGNHNYSITHAHISSTDCQTIIRILVLPHFAFPLAFCHALPTTRVSDAWVASAPFVCTVLLVRSEDSPWFLHWVQQGGRKERPFWVWCFKLRSLPDESCPSSLHCSRRERGKIHSLLLLWVFLQVYLRRLIELLYRYSCSGKTVEFVLIQYRSAHIYCNVYDHCYISRVLWVLRTGFISRLFWFTIASVWENCHRERDV